MLFLDWRDIICKLRLQGVLFAHKQEILLEFFHVVSKSGN